MPEGGRIIVIGSINRDRIPFPGLSAYAMSKSALQGMARGFARDFGPCGITVNVVQPGLIDTDINPADGPMKDIQHGVMAIKRHGRPESVAGMVAWLARPEAGFVTGAIHTIDGGFGACSNAEGPIGASAAQPEPLGFDVSVSTHRAMKPAPSGSPQDARSGEDHGQE